MDGGGGGGGQEGQPPNQGGLSLAQQVQMARAYFKAGDLGAALTILRGSLLDSAADNSRENLKVGPLLLVEDYYDDSVVTSCVSSLLISTGRPKPMPCSF